MNRDDYVTLVDANDDIKDALCAYRESIEARYIIVQRLREKGVGWNEIADALNISRNAAKCIGRRGRAK